MLRNKMLLFPEDAGADSDPQATPPATEPTENLDELKAELARVKAEKEKLAKSVNDLSAENADKKRQIKDRMTAEELKDAELKEKEEKLKALTEQIEQGTLSANKVIAETLTLTVMKDADIKEDDAEFKAFVHSITSTDKDNTTKLAAYLSKIVGQAYAKGVSDTTASSITGTGDGINVGGGKPGEESDYQKSQKQNIQLKDHVDL